MTFTLDIKPNEKQAMFFPETHINLSLSAAREAEQEWP